MTLLFAPGVFLLLSTSGCSLAKAITGIQFEISDKMTMKIGDIASGIRRITNAKIGMI